MRLTDLELKKIRHTFSLSLNQDESLYLVGSRVDDTKKGGDIDLVVLVGSEDRLNEWNQNKLDIVIQLKSQLGEQKIDVTMGLSSMHNKDPFLKVALKKSVRLI